MPKRNKNYFVYSLLIIFILGLTPLLWFHDGCIIKSEDAGIPLNFSEWHPYTYSWFNQRATGTYPIDNFSALFFLFLPALLQKIGFSILLAQKIQFVLWFLTPGLCLYYLLLSIYEGKSPHFLVTLCAAGFYMFNLYLEPVWLGFNIANLSAYAFMPLLLGFFINGMRTGKFVKYICLGGLTALFISGVGANPPIAYACLIIFVLWILYNFIFSVLLKREIKFKTYLKYSLFFPLVIILVNAFWIYPQASRYLKSAQLEPLESYKQSVEKGYDGIIERSKYTSLINVLRLQGAWTWYESYEEDPYVLYSEFYQKNRLFLVLSIVPALCAFLAVFFLRSTKYAIFFILIALMGIAFSVGMHYTPPSYPVPTAYPEGCRPAFLAVIYKFFLNAVPGFWVVRSPWYKWSLLTTLGFAVMIGISAGAVMKRLERFFLISLLVPVLIFAALLRYAFPILTGEIFTTDVERNYISYNHIKIPPYVFEASDWLSRKKDFFRIMVLPSMERRITKWGYAGYEPVISYFTEKPVIAPVLENTFGSPYCIPNMGNFLYKWLYYDKTIENVEKLRELKSNQIAAKILPMFNIGYLLYEKDIRYDFYKNDPSKKIESEDFVHYKLSLQKGLTAEKNFGEWEFYRVENELPHIYAVDDVTLIDGEVKALEPLSRTHFFDYNLIFEDKISTETLGIMRQRRLVGEKILYNYNEAPIEESGEKFCFLLDTENADVFYKTEVTDENVSELTEVSFIEGTFERDNSSSTETGFWMKGGSEPLEARILNKGRKSAAANLKFSCRNIGQEKILRVYLNDRLIKVEKLEADKTKEIKLLNIELVSGENSLKFLAPGEIKFNTNALSNVSLRGSDGGRSNPEGCEGELRDNLVGIASSAALNDINCVRAGIFLDGDFVFYTYEFNAEINVPEERIFYAYLYPYPVNPVREIRFLMVSADGDFSAKGGFPSGEKPPSTSNNDRRLESAVFSNGVNESDYLPASKEVMINDKKIEMSFAGETSEYGAAKPISLKKGRNSVKFLQEGRKGYYFLLSSALPPKDRQLTGARILDNSPVFYKLEFDDLERNDLLFVLNEAFDEGWEAFYRTANGKHEKIPAHFLVNGYANGWYLDLQGKDRHNIVIVLKYANQRGFVTGLGISVLVLTACGIIFIFRNKTERLFQR